MNKYKKEDIEVGDGVYFNVNWQNNFDLYWTVISKDTKNLQIEIDEMGAKGKMWLRIDDVYRVEKRNV